MNSGKITHNLLDQFDRELINRKSIDYLAKYCLIGFACDSKIIKLDENHWIKKEPEKRTNDFYATTGKDETDIYNSYQKYNSFLFFKYSSKSHPSGYPSEVANKSISFEIFIRVFYDNEVSLKYCNRYILHDNKESSSGFVASPRREFYNRSDIKIGRNDLSNLKKFWKLYKWSK
jgi:hypothetical protein